jgi:hypothetical protein
MTVELTAEECRLTLLALWNHRVQTTELWGDSADEVRVIDSVSQKLGADPTAALYGQYPVADAHRCGVRGQCRRLFMSEPQSRSSPLDVGRGSSTVLFEDALDEGGVGGVHPGSQPD